MSLAPIGICTYTRLNHLIRTIDALKANTLARQSELYIFSDGPNKGDEAKVQELRDYLLTITGFKKVHLRLQPENNRFENTSNAHIQLTATHGRSIFMEDDIVTSPCFLEFMNAGLDRYESNKNIFSIGGYSPPIAFPKNHAHDIFFSQIFCPWGAGMWKDRFDMTSSAIAAWDPQFDKGLSSKLKYIGKDLARRYKSLCRAGIKDTELMAKFDLVATVVMLQRQMYSVLPRQTIIENIGLDGSGLNCHVNDARFIRQFDSDYRPTKFNDEPFLDPRIGREVYLQGSFTKSKGPIMRSFYLLVRSINHKLSRL
jgi:hypothetical protein